MKPIGEEQQEVASALNDRAVVDYLLQHPEFLFVMPPEVEHLRVPHPVRGTISLVEWHMMRARNHIHVLEENMSLLMEQAVANESLFQRLLQLQTRLAAAESLDDMLNRLHRWARELGLAGATVRLFPDCWRLGAPSKFTHLALNRQAFEPIRIQRLGRGAPLSWTAERPGAAGGAAGGEGHWVCGDIAAGGDNAPGVMLFSSRDAQHYQPGQGTQLLQEIAQMLPGLLERWIERA